MKQIGRQTGVPPDRRPFYPCSYTSTVKFGPKPRPFPPGTVEESTPVLDQRQWPFGARFAGRCEGEITNFCVVRSRIFRLGSYLRRGRF